MAEKRTCRTCDRRSAEPVTAAVVTRKPLYDCHALNKTPRLNLHGGHAPWVTVGLNFGCVLWKPREKANG